MAIALIVTSAVLVIIARTRDGELLLTSRQDGMIRMLVPDSSAPTTGGNKR